MHTDYYCQYINVLWQNMKYNSSERHSLLVLSEIVLMKDLISTSPIFLFIAYLSAFESVIFSNQFEVCTFKSSALESKEVSVLLCVKDHNSL